MNKKYYVEAEDYNVLVVVAHDDNRTCIVIDVDDIEQAKAMDVTEIEDYVAEQMKDNFPTMCFEFDKDDDDYIKVEELN